MTEYVWDIDRTIPSGENRKIFMFCTPIKEGGLETITYLFYFIFIEF